MTFSSVLALAQLAGGLIAAEERSAVVSAMVFCTFVALAATVSAHFKFGYRSHIEIQLALDLQRELGDWETGRGSYGDDANEARREQRLIANAESHLDKARAHSFEMRV